MQSSREVWIAADPETRDRMRGKGFRLAMAYYDRDTERLESLMPSEELPLKLVMAALSDSLYALNQIDPPNTPEVVWSNVCPIIDSTAPRDVRPRVRALLALISHTMRTAELNRAYLAEEGDPSASVHLFSAIMAMRVAERPESIGLMRERADELDPP